MTQPDYVPIASVDQVRPLDTLSQPPIWTQDRPAEVRGTVRPEGDGFGTPGPDQGYALTLATRFEERLVLAEGETVEDAVQGCLGVALRRAAVYGRAPVVYDLEHAFTLWGFLGGAPADLVAYRRAIFQAASHDYHDQRAIADLVPDETLRLTPSQVASRLSEWRTLIPA